MAGGFYRQSAEGRPWPERLRGIAQARPPAYALVAFAACYVLGAWLASSILMLPSTGVTFWPPSGLFLATLLLSERRQWSWWLGTGLLTELVANAVMFQNPMLAALSISAGNALEAVAGAWLIGQWCRLPLKLETLSETIVLSLFGVLIAPMISATIGSLTLAALGESFEAAWAVWWIGDAAGVAVFAPLFLLAAQLPHAWQNLSAARWIEAIALAAILIGVTHLSISGALPFTYIIIPFLLWIALRFRMRGAVLAILAVAVITIFHTIDGTNVFLERSKSDIEALLWTEIFLAVSAVMALVIATLTQQHDKALSDVRIANNQLESIVNERTARLRESEDRLQLAQRAARAGAWEMDIDTNALIASDIALELYGIEPGTAVDAQQLLDRVHPEDRRQVREALKRCRRENALFKVEVRIPQSDGSMRWLLSQAELRRTGKARRLVGLMQDITQLKNAEEALRASEQHLQTAVEAAELGTWELDMERDLMVSRSPRHDEIFGYMSLQAEWGQRIAEQHVIEEDRQAFRDAVLRSAETGRMACEVRVKWPDGSIHWISKAGRAYYDQHSRSVRLAGVIADITERKHASELARRSSEVYFRLIQDNPFGIYVVDADFRLAQISDGAKRTFGSTEPLIGRDFAEVLRQLWAEPFASEAIGRFRHTLLTGEPYHSRNTSKRRADIGEIETYDWKIERVVLPDSRFGVVCYFYDMTERQRHEERVRMLMREVNHRSKNMLALVHSIARQTAATNPKDFVEEFEQRILALSASHDLLISSGWRGVRLPDLVESQLAHFKGLLGSRISAQGPDITLDAAAAQTMGMALHELATNAGKYGALSGKKGRVAIRWNVTPAAGPDRMFEMSWIESGGPPATPPERRGFGTTVIDRMCRMSLGANVTLDYAKSGFSWKLSCPLLHLTQGASEQDIESKNESLASAELVQAKAGVPAKASSL